MWIPILRTLSNGPHFGDTEGRIGVPVCPATLCGAAWVSCADVLPPSRRDAQPGAFLQTFSAFLPPPAPPWGRQLSSPSPAPRGRQGSVLSFPTRGWWQGRTGPSPHTWRSWKSLPGEETCPTPVGFGRRALSDKGRILSDCCRVCCVHRAVGITVLGPRGFRAPKGAPQQLPRTGPKSLWRLWLHTRLFTALLTLILCVLQAQLWLSLGF